MTEESAATVELVEGDVRIFNDTKTMRRVKANDPINVGDSIVTGVGGEIHLRMLDGGTIAVRPNTKMRIAQFRAEGDDQDKGVFGLLSGSFRSITGWIGRYNPRGYMVRTPTATIGVRGTDHEPLVIPPDSREGEPGTYDKVNVGGTYIQTPSGRIDVPEMRAAFVPHGAKPGGPVPRLLDAVPTHYRSTRNEHLLEHRHETTQRILESHRDDRRKLIQERKAPSESRHLPAKARADLGTQPNSQEHKAALEKSNTQPKAKSQVAPERQTETKSRADLPSALNTQQGNNSVGEKRDAHFKQQVNKAEAHPKQDEKSRQQREQLARTKAKERKKVEHAQNKQKANEHHKPAREQ